MELVEATEVAKASSIVRMMPLKHQFAKLLLGTIAGFAATKLTEKGYESALKCWQTSHPTPIKTNS